MKYILDSICNYEYTIIFYEAEDKGNYGSNCRKLQFHIGVIVMFVINQDYKLRVIGIDYPFSNFGIRMLSFSLLIVFSLLMNNNYLNNRFFGVGCEKKLAPYEVAVQVDNGAVISPRICRIRVLACTIFVNITVVSVDCVT